MDVTVQSETKARHLCAAISDAALADVWMELEARPHDKYIGKVCEWVLDEMGKRMGDALFDEWLFAFDAEGRSLHPMTYFNRR